METNENQTQLDDLLKDLPTVSKVDIYKADEMIVCDKCSRNNPPTRLDCLYCGTDLNIRNPKFKSEAYFTKNRSP